MKSCWAATNEEGRKSGYGGETSKGCIDKLPGFLDFFAFLTFSLSALLSSEYSSKSLLCCSSQDDGNAVAILY